MVGEHLKRDTIGCLAHTEVRLQLFFSKRNQKLLDTVVADAVKML
jgi:hypothetical protein